MKVVNLEKTEVNPKDYVKRVARESDYETLIKETCILKHDNKIIGLYLKLPKMSQKVLEAVKSLTYDVNHRTAGLVTTSKIFGFMPREVIRKDYCSSTAFARESPKEHNVICQYATELAKHYKKHCPEIYNEHNDLVQQKVSPNWTINNTPFTSGIVNKNNQLNYHWDSGNFNNVYSNMLAYKKDIIGGHLAMPEYNIGLEIANNSVTFFDGQSILHGVTPIKYMSKDAYRYTLVYYSLKQMWKCLDPKEELDRVKRVKTEREFRRYQRLKGDIPNTLTRERDDK